MNTKQSLSKANAAQAGTRGCLERMTKEWAIIRRGQGHVNCSTLAAEFECSVKTIYRDLEFLRDRIGLPLVYVHESRDRPGTWKVEKDAKLPWWIC